MSQSDQLHVVTENGEQCFLWRAGQLTYIGPERRELPRALASRFGPLASKLDLSYNRLSSCRNIRLFSQLSELILDNNRLEDEQLREGLRPNLRLKILSLNKNRLAKLPELIKLIKIYFPNLELLSLIGNPLWPDAGLAKAIELPVGERLDDRGLTIEREPPAEPPQETYRNFIIYHMPNLRFLDSKLISQAERDESLRRSF